MCRYDVKYGSGGFNTNGYQAGCAYVNGTFEDALADPVAGRFLCSPDDDESESCFSDFSGQGVCRIGPRFFGEDYNFYAVDLVCLSLE